MHTFEDAAVEYLWQNGGTCSFCLCTVREASGHNGSSMHFTAKPSAGSKAWSSCNIAYRLGRTAATHCRSGSLAHPSPLRSSHCSLASSTVDIVSVEELTARVERWSRVVKENLSV